MLTVFLSLPSRYLVKSGSCSFRNSFCLALSSWSLPPFSVLVMCTFVDELFDLWFGGVSSLLTKQFALRFGDFYFVSSRLNSMAHTHFLQEIFITNFLFIIILFVTSPIYFTLFYLRFHTNFKLDCDDNLQNKFFMLTWILKSLLNDTLYHTSIKS